MNNNSSNINVNINFKANTEAAKNNINSLQSLLTQITQTKNIGLDSSALGQAKASAQELQMHLENAVNVNTGKLDLGKFNASLKAAGSDLATLSSNLQNVGPVGQQAFMKLAKAIASAQTPMLNVSNAIAQFGKTLVNTVKWQLASNLIHGVQGALQAAVSHAKDLNSALNDIRIVTGYSIDRMSEFVNEARAASKELNTTTTEYAKASLIFFQQGLTGDAVKERTDVVIKMSQVTHESAQNIASELTAIWNNFDDGTHSLEWYADAITALGASTASSSKEIAQGLQKFAAVADTVGLSYEYATAALATVVAETRQSADIVGTSFKTIFSRLEGLKLGETLDDGTDLNKYSAALLTVGVNIKKANGDLKDMDEILDELGDRWQLLSKDQQVALAQTVGGVRQYQQFIALADNWSKVQKNVEIARNSDGTLEKQQQIWSESFEAATKRVEEAKKQLYEDLINDNTLIKLNDTFSAFIGSINQIIKAAGGIVPVILTIVALLSSTLWPLLMNGFNRLRENIGFLTGKAQTSITETQNLLKSQMEEALSDSRLSEYQQKQILITRDLINAKQRLEAASKSMSMAQRQEAEMQYQIYEARQQELLAIYEELDALEREIDKRKKLLEANNSNADAVFSNMDNDTRDAIETNVTHKKETAVHTALYDRADQALGTDEEEIVQTQLQRYEELIQKQDELNDAEKSELSNLEEIATAYDTTIKKAVDGYNDVLDRINRVKQAEQDQPTATGFMSARDRLPSTDDENSKSAQLYNSMRDKVSVDTGGTQDVATGTLDVSASVDSLESVANSAGRFNEIAASLKQILTDLVTPLTETTAATEALKNVTDSYSEEQRENNGISEEEAQILAQLNEEYSQYEEATAAAAYAEKKFGSTSQITINARKNLEAAEKRMEQTRSKLLKIEANGIKTETNASKVADKLIKSRQRLTKATQQSSKVTQNWSKTQQSLIKTMQGFGEAAGLSEDQVQDLTSKLQNLTPEQVKSELPQILQPFISSAEAAGGECTILKERIRDALIAQGYDPTEINALMGDAEQAGKKFVDLKNKEEEAGLGGEKSGKKLSETLTGVAGVLGKVSMGYTALKSVVNVWSDEDASLLDKIMSSMMSLSMLLPVLTGEHGLFNAAKSAGLALDKIFFKNQSKKLAAWAVEKAKIAEESGTVWANAAAWVAKQIASYGWVGLILGGLLLAAIAMVCVALVNERKKTEESTAAIKKQNEAQAEQGKSVKDLAEKWYEQTHTMDELIAKYKTLTKNTEEYNNTVKELLESIPELIETYENAGKGLGLNTEELKEYDKKVQELKHAAAAGDIDRVLELRNELDAITAKASADKVQKGAIGAASNLAVKFDESEVYAKGDATVEGNKLKLRISGDQRKGEEDEQKVVNSILAHTTGGQSVTEGNWHGANLELDTSDPAQFVAQYEGLRAAYDEMSASLTAEEKQRSEAFQRLQGILEETKDDYEELAELAEAFNTYNIEALAHTDEFKPIDEVDNYAEYLEYREQLIQAARAQAEAENKNADEAQKAAEAWLDSQEILSELTQTNNKIGYISDKYGKKIADEAQEYVKELNDDDAKLFLKIDFSKAATKEAWDAQMDMLRAAAEQEDLQVKITGVTTALGKLKETDMTSEDWNTIKESVDWDAAGVAFTDFLAMSYSEQKTFLEQMQTGLTDAYQDSLEETTEIDKEHLEQLKNDLADATKEADDAYDYYNELLAQQEELKKQKKDGAVRAELALIEDEISKTKTLMTEAQKRRDILQESVELQKQSTDAMSEQALIQQRIKEDAARAAITQAETLNDMYNAIAHLKTLTQGELDKNLEWDALRNLGGQYSNALQETSEFERIQNAFGTAQQNAYQQYVADAQSKLDHANSDLESFIASGQADKDYGNLYRKQGAVNAAERTVAEGTERMNEALQPLMAEMAKAEDKLKSAILIGEHADKYDLDPEAVEAQARSIRVLNEEMGLSAEQAARMAIANQRMNKGINTLSDSLEDWKETLKTAKKGDTDWAKTIGEVEAAVKDLIGATDDFELPDDFLDAPENMKLLEKAANGDQVAINTLGIQLTRSAMDINTWSSTLIDSWNAFAATEDGAAAQLQSFSEDMQTYFDNANLGMQALQDNIKALTDGSMTLTEALASVDLDEESWIESLNAMAIATGMSVEQMNSMLNQLGVQAHVEVKDVPQKQMVPTYTEYSEPAETVEIQQGENPDGTPKMVKYTAVRHHTVQGPSIEVDGYTQVAQISTEDNPLTPQINESKVSFTGVGGGKTGGGVGHSNTTSGKKSGSGSKKEKKDKKSSEKETERYHEITALIEDYTRELDKAGKAKDRAFGPKKLKAMQAEIAAQAQLNAATEEHIREIREWLEIDKARIAAQGATFDEYGNISNYTALMQQHIDAYNAAVAAYNASGQSDSDKNRFEAAEKAYQDFMDQLSQYEETNDLLQEKLDELIEAQQAKYDKEFEMLQYTIEFKIEADDSILSYLDYMKNKIENFNDGVHDAVEMLATLNNEAAALMDKNSTYNRAIDDTLNHYLSNKGMGESEIEAFINRFKSNNMSQSDMSMLEDMTEAEYQYLLELKDNLLEINNSLIENMNAVVETVQNSFSKTAEDLDKAVRPIERAASALENYAAIIDIVGRDALGITDAIAAELDNAAVAVAHSATVAAKAKVDTLQSERDEVQRLYDEAMAQGLTEMAYKWKTALEEMDDEIAAATDDFNSKWQEELTKAREAFENTVERIKQSMLDAFAGSIGSWSALKDSLEYAKTAADRFVPQYKEIYELSKLNRDIMKSIDNTSNIKNKQALRDLQKEINELEQHSGEISQYDLDNARRRYELELARLQLEEARDAKSTVRLSKDSEGNWSYVYTANQDEVEKAEQNYEDKLYAMQQANNEYINSLSDQILELEEQYAEKLAEIRLDNTMSEEERNAAIERLNAYFAEQMEYLTNEGQKAVDNNARLFEEEWTTYHNWTDAFGNDVQARIDNQHDFMTQFGDTILGTYTGYGNFDELNTAMVRIAEEASREMEEAYGTLQEQVAAAMKDAGIDVAHFGEVVHDTVNNQIVPSAQAAENAVVKMGKAAVDEFKELTDGVSAWQTKYATEMQKIIKKNEKLAKSVNSLATAYANLVAQMYAAAEAPAPKAPKFGHGATNAYEDVLTDSDKDGKGPTSPTSPTSPKPDPSKEKDGSPYWLDDRNYQTHSQWQKYKDGHTVKLATQPHHYTLDSEKDSNRRYWSCTICGFSYVEYLRGNQVVQTIYPYDTGGYTGDWNSSEGKLAILHEKELVLNKDDTKNILGTVEMVRKLSQKIDLNAQTARYAFNYHPIISDPKPIDRELQVDQTVSITAEFPNVQNRTEIEEAFTMLINQASQYANQKN